MVGARAYRAGQTYFGPVYSSAAYAFVDCTFRPASKGEALWRALDLVVRRYAIGEAIAADHYGKAQRLTRQYVDAAGLALR